jgi:hypothetical protein
VLIGPFIVGGIMLHRAVGRAGAEPPVPAGLQWRRREIAAVLLLGPGAVLLPILAPVFGLVCAAASPRWGWGTKLFATAITIAPVGVVILYYLFPVGGFAWPWVLLPIALVVLGPILAAVVLALTIKDRD